MTEDLYEVLGVPKDVDRAAIRKAYRKKAMKAHPDQGGDPKTFALIKLADDVLSDDDRRARYDATGDTAERASERGSVDEQAQSLIIETLDTVLMKCSQENVEPSTVKLIVTVIDALGTLRGQIEEANRGLARQAAGNEKLAKRFSAKKGDNAISPVFLRRAQQQRNAIDLNVGKIAIVDRARELAQNYDFQTDVQMSGFYGWDMAADGSLVIPNPGRPLW